MIKLRVFTTALILLSLFGLNNEVAGKPSETCLTTEKADHRYGSYSPSGKEIIFESNLAGNWDIYLMKSDGSNIRALTNSALDERRPSWHPNGKQIIFESTRSGITNLHRLDIESKTTQPLEGLDSKLGDAIFARYSPNGKEIAVSLKKSDTHSNIAILNEDGELKQLVTDFKVRSFYPQWSNDGASIVFHSRYYSDNKDDEIVVWDRDSSKLKRLTSWPTHNFCPAWSKNDQKIAYVQSVPDSRPEIFVMSADGSAPRQITFNQDGETLPNWSPDGGSLLVTAYREGHYQICSIEL